MNACANPNWLSWIEEAPRPLCDVPWVGTSVVLSNGDVNFCCFSEAVVGNVNEEPFEKIWNGEAMQQIRRSLTDQHLPPQCQSSSCPIYRHDNFHYILRRMNGEDSIASSEPPTADRYRHIRESLEGSSISVANRGLRVGDEIELNIILQYHGVPLRADLFIAVRAPDGVHRFLPDAEDFAVPSQQAIELRDAQAPIRFSVRGSAECLPTAGAYDICAALFAQDSNPNLRSNCYWSQVASFLVPSVP
jgi:radical SAM protein with 4Fe4S-binding SPASM domain